MNKIILSKFKATSIHLGISLVLFLTLANIIYFMWYPQPYFSSSGGWQGMRLIAAVDLVLGPALTFVIFNPAKSLRAIRFDYSIIAIIQISAIVYGMYATYTQRPIAIVYDDGLFQPVIAEMLEDQDIGINRIPMLSQNNPPLVYSREAKDKSEAAGIVTWAFVGGVPKHGLAFLFEPLSENIEKLSKKKEINLKQLKQSKASFNELNHLLTKNNLSEHDIIIAPFTARYGSAWLVFAADGKLLSYITRPH